MWKDEHEHKAKTETDQNRGFGFQFFFKFNFFFENRNCGFCEAKNRKPNRLSNFQTVASLIITNYKIYASPQENIQSPSNKKFTNIQYCIDRNNAFTINKTQNPNYLTPPKKVEPVRNLVNMIIQQS